MTYEEALKHYEENICKFCRAKYCENCPTATAKTAMGKQIAKNIIVEVLPQALYDEYGDFLIDVYSRKFKCPTCGIGTGDDNPDVKSGLNVTYCCENCGQKLIHV